VAGPTIFSPALEQLIAFLEALALGALFAFTFDLYRALRLLFRRLPPALSAAADCLFWLAAAVAAVSFLIYRRWGEIHLYIYIGLAGGFLLYIRFLSGYLLPLWLRSCAYLARLFRRPADDKK